MDRIIRINGVDVVKGLCKGDFILDSSIITGGMKSTTHNEVYTLLDTANEIIETSGELLNSGIIAVMVHGGIRIDVTYKGEWK